MAFNFFEFNYGKPKHSTQNYYFCLMCGIAGFINTKFNEKERKDILSVMLKSIEHRGPDATNQFHNQFVSLGHNRLSIIDLSDESNQPFCKGDLILIFNGEIYNYKELREQLKSHGSTFITSGDTEVLLEGYRIHGEKILDLLLGMFSFVLYNKLTGEVFGARDRFGIKPFYYIYKNSSFFFASEVKALRTIPGFDPKLNENQVNLYLNLAWLYNGDETLHLEVKNLKPGHKFNFSNGTLKISTYYELTKINEQLNEDEAIEKFEHFFADSLKMHLRTDVQLGALLSGGIDSSAIVTYILKNKFVESLKTFSIYYDQDRFDERPFIQEVIDQHKNNLTPFLLSPKETNIVSELNRITHIQDFPVIGSSAISQYFIMEAVSKQGIKVVLSGQGADDYLGGYMHSYYRFYAGLLKQLRLLKFYKEFRFQKKYQGLSRKDVLNVLSKTFLSSLLSESNLYKLELNYYNPKIVETGSRSSINLENAKQFGELNGFLFSLMTKTNLPNLLHLEDRNSMAFSIESRVPFLDHRLVEWGLNSSPDLKIKDGLTKFILREACKSSLPSKIHQRKDKKGFVTPGEVTWLRNDLKFLLNNFDNYPVALSKKKLTDMTDSFAQGNNKHANFIWRTAMLKYWHDNL